MYHRYGILITLLADLHNIAYLTIIIIMSSRHHFIMLNKQFDTMFDLRLMSHYY